MTSHSNNGVATERFNLSRWALQQQSLVVFLMLVSLLAGVWSYFKLGRNEDPPFTIKTMVVQAHWPGATTKDAVNLVTDKLEQTLEETPYLDRLDSYTRDGTSVIFVNLRDDTPPQAVADVWYQVRKKVGDMATTLPRGVLGPYFDDEFGDTFGIVYGFVTEGFSDRELRDRLDVIRAELLKLPDVGKIRLLGVQEEQVVIEFSPRKLAALGLDPKQVMEAISAQNSVNPSGLVRLPSDKVGIRVSGAFASEESLRAITLRVANRYVPLTDLATISRIASDPPSPTFRVNGQRAMGLAISMTAAGNLTEFGKAIKAKMSEIEARLPYGIEVISVADQTEVVKSAIGGFMKVLLEAIAIVLAVSFVSLGTRAGLVVAVSIPLVLALTFVGMDIAGIGLQRISLGALIIALGLLVDDAMITVEAMVSKLEEGWTLQKSATFAYESTAFPMLTGTLVMIAGFIPVGFAASSAGEYCFSMFMVVLIALSASWIVAVLFSPLLGTWLLPRSLAGSGHAEGRLMFIFRQFLALVLAHRWATIAIAIASLVVALIASTRIEQQFFPASDRPELLVTLTLPQNSSINETDAYTKKLERILKEDPDVSHFSTYVGSGAIRFYLPMDVLLTNDNVSQTVVVAKGLDQRDALRARLEKAFASDFGAIVARATPLELGPPVGWPLKYRITGPDPAKVREIAMEVANVVSSASQSRDVNLTAGEPQRVVEVRVNQIEAASLGLSSQNISEALASIFSGMTITAIRDGKRLVDVTARAMGAERLDLDTIANLQIAGGGNTPVTLRQVADLSYGVEDPVIWRRQREPIITVQADVSPGVQPTSVAAELAPALARFSEGLPAGYRITEGGVVEESSKGNASVISVVPMMLLVMATLLMVQLRSFARAAIALLMAPFGLIGVVLALLPTGTPMGFVAQLGVIALAGMIIRNAVILIEEADRNVESGLAPGAAVTQAALHRARPIMLTALAAILGMIPIAPQIFWGPMAYSIIGGLAVATLLTLTVLPALIHLLLDLEARLAKDRRIDDTVVAVAGSRPTQ